MSRQKLIHLHGKSRLADVNKLNFGEIAVRNGSSATETELAVLTNINGAKGEVVYIPSLATVTGLTNAVDVKVTAANTAIKELQDAVGFGENASGETLTDRVGGLEDILNGKEGEEGLVDKVSANTAAISANTEALTTKLDTTAYTADAQAMNLRVTTVENAITDATTGLTKQVTDLNSWVANSGATKTYAEEKATAALNSATANTESVRSDLQGKIDAANGRIDDLDDILNGKGEEVGLVDKVSANTAAISANTANISANTAAISANTEAIKTKLDASAYTESYTAINTRVTTVENAINDATTGLTKQVTDLNSWVANSGATKTYAEEKATAALNSATANTESVRSGLQGQIDAEKLRIDGLVTSAGTFVTKEELNALDFNSGTTENIVRGEGENMTTAATISVGAEQVDGKITKVTVATDGLATMYDINSLTGETSALETKVNTLIGDDTGKSVRKIANEELAAQLILSDAAESLDSLQEIAQWIQDHPEDAAAMNKQISNIEEVLDGYMTEKDGEVTISTVKADISGLTANINAVDAIAKAAVKEVKTSGITGVVVNTAENVATIDFSLMTIDCGSYDVADAE